MTRILHARTRIGLLILFLILGLAPCASADVPVLPRGQHVFYISVSLLAESLFLALILIPRKFRWVRMFFMWIIVTTITWVGLVVFLIISADVFRGWPLAVILALILTGELLVIVVEAVILRYLSTSEYFGADVKAPLRITSALGYSFLANAVSIIAWIVAIYLAPYLGFRTPPSAFATWL